MSFMNLLPAPTPTRFVGKMHKKMIEERKKSETNLLNNKSKPSSRRSSTSPSTETIKEIKGSTSKWCFDSNVHNATDRQIADLNYIKLKCQQLVTKTLTDFDFELTQIIFSLRRLFSSVGSKMETFETSEITTYQDPDLAKYNKKNRKTIIANERAKFSYYSKEIKEMTKRYELYIYNN